MCIAYLTGAPFVPSKRATADAMINLAHIKKGDTVYDLGSGNGKLLLLASKKGAETVGFEINPLLVLFSNLRGAPTRWKNFWHADIHDADVIFIYLIPWKMKRLVAKIKKECKQGTIIVSNSFIFPNWKILRQDVAHHVYVFRI
jgi:16S rRNA A1518/A1519 N6-dimethyltransferase RsmA/KsgA/DIM1 with predicted DNA glycosylase/AP lyase activity